MLRFPQAHLCCSFLLWPQPPAPGKSSDSSKSLPKCHFLPSNCPPPYRCHVCYERLSTQLLLKHTFPQCTHSVWAGGVRAMCHCPPTVRGSGMNSTLDKVSITFGRWTTYQADVRHGVHFLSKNNEKLSTSSFIHINGGSNYCPWISSSFLYKLGGSLDHDAWATSGCLKTLDHRRLALGRQCFCLMNLIFHF